ncbi:unnamed protein product [Soboliphyme baturini]|uniref:Uncharacterized protein n=1 Tax=Soboliphyme baturini TaxID=241478 RepID=A0A183J9A6_9BILA|nr:unnamed protein product [Soboliphyme baturini]
MNGRPMAATENQVLCVLSINHDRDCDDECDTTATRRRLQGQCRYMHTFTWPLSIATGRRLVDGILSPVGRAEFGSVDSARLTFDGMVVNLDLWSSSCPSGIAFASVCQSPFISSTSVSSHCLRFRSFGSFTHKAYSTYRSDFRTLATAFLF